MRQQGGGLGAPFLGLLVCLFVLSLLAPRSWERVARNRPLGKSPNAEKRSGAGPTVASRVERRSPVIATQGPRRASVTSRVHGPHPGSRHADAQSALDLIPPGETISGLWRPDINDLAAEAAQDVTLFGPRLSIASRPTPAEAAPPVDCFPLDDLEAAWIAAAEMCDEPASSAAGPQALYERLARLAERPGCTIWSFRVAALVRELHGREATANYARRLTLLDHLEAASQECDDLAQVVGEGVGASEVRRAKHALDRRIDLWRRVAELRRTDPSLVVSPQPDPARLHAQTVEVAALTGDSDEGARWREFLLLDAIRSAAASPSDDEDDQRRLTLQVLERLEATRMTRAQRSFVAREPIAGLTEALRDLAARPVDVEQTLARLEQYEQAGLTADARWVALASRDLAYSRAPQARDLADLIDEHYRGTNLRVAVAEELINRLLPNQAPQSAPVFETILGVPVRGQGTTTTDLTVELVPDDARLRLALAASGLVDSRTTSRSGPARFWNDGHSRYFVRALLNVTPEGIELGGVDGHATVSSRLRNFETDYDGVPLVGSLVRGFVERAYQQRRGAARRESERKVVSRAESRIAEEAAAMVAQANRKFDERVRQVLDELGFDAPASRLQTTDRRLVARFRLATDEQLGAHTPRPRAPSDSLLSLQLHESAMNNLVEQLDLDGRQFSIPELHKWIALKLHLEPPAVAGPSHEEDYVTFADEDALRVRCRDDRIELTLSLAEVDNPGHRFRNFQVRVFYRPESEGLHATLVRDGTIQLIGHGLGAKGQVALRGVFSRMFSRERRLTLVPERLADDARLDDLAVTQLVIEDGWIGLAVGPRRSTSTLPVALVRP